MIDRSVIRDFLRHPAGMVIAGVCVVALILTASALAYMVLNYRAELENAPDSALASIPAPAGASEQSDFVPQPETEPIHPPTGCYWRSQNGYPYAMAYAPVDVPDTLDDKPLVGYAVVWQFAQDEIIVKRHEDNYRLSQWPIAYYLADESANRVLLEVQGLYEAEGERTAGESVKQTCSTILP